MSACVSDIDEHGIAVVENFLHQTTFDEVKNEFDRAFEKESLRPYKDNESARLLRSQILLSDLAAAAPRISECFQRNDWLNSIASATVRRRISRTPDVHLDWYQCGDLTAIDNDIENILHADLHTATVKMFFYLEDVNESNGAFVYAKGSHRLTFGRLRHEYEFSVRQARLKKGLAVDGSLLESRGKVIRNIIHPKYRQQMGIRESPLCVRKNTLVIANNMGFHRRGEFTCNQPRKSIQVNYRYLEEPFGARFLSRNGR
jgi:hypothetical protein